MYKSVRGGKTAPHYSLSKKANNEFDFIKTACGFVQRPSLICRQLYYAVNQFRQALAIKKAKRIAL